MLFFLIPFFSKASRRFGVVSGLLAVDRQLGKGFDLLFSRTVWFRFIMQKANFCI